MSDATVTGRRRPSGQDHRRKQAQLERERRRKLQSEARARSARNRKDLQERVAQAGLTDDDDDLPDVDDDTIFHVTYRPYEEPNDVEDLEECRRVDAINKEHHAVNQHYGDQIQKLFQLTGVSRKWKIPAPPEYYKTAYENWKIAIHGKHLRNLYAVEFLARQDPPHYPVRDYPSVHEAGDRAEAIVRATWLQEKLGKGVMVNITEFAPPGHAGKCRCRCLWDGKSARCSGGKLALAWKPAADHHFLFPKYIPSVSAN